MPKIMILARCLCRRISWFVHLFLSYGLQAKQSPGMRQWWELKARYADVLLLFKVGKFYELYHMDASVAVNELGLVYMRGSYAHCGFPEVAFPRMAYALVKKVLKYIIILLSRAIRLVGWNKLNRLMQ